MCFGGETGAMRGNRKEEGEQVEENSAESCHHVYLIKGQLTFVCVCVCDINIVAAPLKRPLHFIS